MDQFLHVRSNQFPILPGEEEELINEGMYGKALALYLQDKLSARGYDVPLVGCEDWGWWVEVKMAPFGYGVCIYCCNPERDPLQFVCTDSPVGNRKWNWRKFQFVETTPYREKLMAELISIFEDDEEVEFLGVTQDIPG